MELEQLIEKWNKNAVTLNEAEKLINMALIDRAQLIDAVRSLIVDVDEMTDGNDENWFGGFQEGNRGNWVQIEWPNLAIHMKKLRGLVK